MQAVEGSLPVQVILVGVHDGNSEQQHQLHRHLEGAAVSRDGGHPRRWPMTHAQTACVVPPSPLQSPGATQPHQPAGRGTSHGSCPPSTHPEDLEEPPVPGLPPPLAVVQGAEGSGEDVQGGLLGGKQRPVLLACEGPRWLSRVGAPQSFPHAAAVSCRPQGDPPAPGQHPATAAPWAQSHEPAAWGSLGPPTTPGTERSQPQAHQERHTVVPAVRA